MTADALRSPCIGTWEGVICCQCYERIPSVSVWPSMVLVWAADGTPLGSTEQPTDHHPGTQCARCRPGGLIPGT